MKGLGKEVALMTYQGPSLLTWFPLSYVHRLPTEAASSGVVTTKPAEGREFVSDFLGLLGHMARESLSLRWATCLLSVCSLLGLG